MNKKYFEWDIVEEKAEAILTRWSTPQFCSFSNFKCGPDIFVRLACSRYRCVSRVPKDQMRRWTSAEVYATARCRLEAPHCRERNQFYDEFITTEHLESYPLLWSRKMMKNWPVCNMKIAFLYSRLTIGFILNESLHWFLLISLSVEEDERLLRRPNWLKLWESMNISEEE